MSTKMSEVLAAINQKMHEGKCPEAGCIGECAAIDETFPGVWWAALYIWQADFNDSGLVAQWFYGFPDFPVDGALCRAANDRMKG